MQDLYDRGDLPCEYDCITLENEYLKAEILPGLGGKLWSLYDKKAGKDLLFTNSIVRPCNLAVRNAWTSGGVEFNCGMVGHHPFTCSRIFAARTALSDGTPVLRVYEYERVRSCVYQIDFFLPDSSPLLYVRVRIVNPTRRTTPMYWWSNIAVPEDKTCRNVIPATETYNNKGGVVGKNSVPFFEERDITYPTNNPTAIDFFWKIPPAERKFTSYLNADGDGLVQVSTSRQQGRKLFVWGQGPGGDRWQSFLTSDGEVGRYVEIQAGAAHTQYECIPMPPLTAWEWLEGYGALHADGKKVHGEWNGAVAEVKTRLEILAPEKNFNKLLSDTHEMAVSPAQTMLSYGSGYGALENLRRQKQGEPAMCPHLDFGEISEEQRPWAQLLQSGEFPDSDKTPSSWMLQPEWTQLLEKSKPNCACLVQLSAIYFASRQFDRARKACEESLILQDNAAGRFILSQLDRVEGNAERYVSDIFSACRQSDFDLSYARAALSAALENGKNKEALILYDLCPASVRGDGRMRMYRAFALLRLSDIASAEAELHKDGGINVTDIREGEISITSLYIEIERAKAKRDGVEFVEENVEIPLKYDFRMSAKRK